jgi:hypothetical protein
MKIAVGFIYVLWNIVYLSPIIPNTRFWHGSDKIAQSLFLSCLCYFIQEYIRHNQNERLFFEYLKWLTFANSTYLSFCLIKDKTFAIYNTPIFAYILALGFIAFLIHCALNNKE